MKRTIFSAILILVTTSMAWAANTEKKRLEVLEMIRQHVFAVHYDPAGPPHWNRVWVEELLPLTVVEDDCTFYRRLNEALTRTGVSHLAAAPPGARPVPYYREQLDVIHLDGRAWIGQSPMVAALGLEPGSEILRINDEPYFSYYDSYLCGNERKPRHLSLRTPEGTLTEITIPRRWPIIEEGGAVVTSSRPAPGIGCLQVDSFQGGGYQPLSVDRALKTLTDAEALILDLRRNNGGHLPAVRHLLAHFFNDPVELGRFISRRNPSELQEAEMYRRQFSVKKVVTTYRTGQRRDVMTVKPRRKPFNGPMVVLVGRHTASAAEVAARRLQTSERAVLIGENTAGEVLSSTRLELPDGGRLMLPLFHYLDSTETPIEGSGVVPDIHVAFLVEDLASGRDRAMEAAVDHLRLMLEGGPKPIAFQSPGRTCPRPAPGPRDPAPGR